MLALLTLFSEGPAPERWQVQGASRGPSGDKQAYEHPRLHPVIEGPSPPASPRPLDLAPSSPCTAASARPLPGNTVPRLSSRPGTCAVYSACDGTVQTMLASALSSDPQLLRGHTRSCARFVASDRWRGMGRLHARDRVHDPMPWLPCHSRRRAYVERKLSPVDALSSGNRRGW